MYLPTSFKSLQISKAYLITLNILKTPQIIKNNN